MPDMQLDAVHTTWLQGFITNLRDGTITSSDTLVTKLLARGFITQEEFNLLMPVTVNYEPAVLAEVVNDYFFGGATLSGAIEARTALP